MELIQFKNILFRNKIQMRGGRNFLIKKILNSKKLSMKRSVHKKETLLILTEISDRNRMATHLI